MSTALSAPKDYEELLNKYDTWMFDCDGVLWSGDKVIDGAIEVLDILRSHSTSPASNPSRHKDVLMVDRKRRKLCLLPTTPPNRGRTTRKSSTI